MYLSVRCVIGVILGVAVFYLYVSNVRPVGWFDTVVGGVLGFLVFVVAQKFKGFKR